MSIFRRNRQPQPKYWITPGGDYSILADKCLQAEHTLIAGTTGCGKTSFLRSVLRALLVKQNPDQAKLMIIDPKQFELMEYEHLPHVIRYDDTKQGAAQALKQAADMVDGRAAYMKQNRTKQCDMPDVYIIIDELNDLMIDKQNGANIKANMEHIITLGRAVKIHLIALTQNPNAKTIPANIVDCYTCRIGMKCLRNVQSRQIVGINGCENLPKHGAVIAVLDGDVGIYKAPDYIPENGNDDLIAFWERQAH